MSPNAAVDLPLPSPVCTISSGRFAALPGGQPVLGDRRRLALRHQAAFTGEPVTRPASGAAASSSSRRHGAPRCAARSCRQAEPDRPALAVDDDAGDAAYGPAGRCGLAASTGDGSAGCAGRR